MIADGLGRAVAFILAPGQAHELPQAIPLLDPSYYCCCGSRFGRSVQPALTPVR